MPYSMLDQDPSYLFDDEEDDQAYLGGSPAAPSSPFGNSLPPAPKISTAAQDKLASFMESPTAKKPKLWQRLAAAAVGGIAGYSNAEGRAPRIDAAPAIEGILQPNLKRDQAKWSAEYDQAQRAAQGEQRSNQQAVTGYRAQIEAAKAESDAKAKGAQADYYRKRAEAVDAGEWKPSNGAAVQSRTGATKALPQQPPAYIRPGYGYPKLGADSQPVRDEQGNVVYETPVPAAKKETRTTSSWSGLDDPDPKVREMAKRSIEAEINRKDRSGEPKPVDPIEHEEKARTLLSKEQDSAYKNAEAQRTHELAALDKTYAPQVTAMRKAGKKADAAALEAEHEAKRRQIEKSHVQRKNAIEKKLAARRRQLHLSSDENPAGQYDDDGTWRPFGGGEDLQAPDPIEPPVSAPAAPVAPRAQAPAASAPAAAAAPPPVSTGNPYRRPKTRM